MSLSINHSGLRILRGLAFWALGSHLVVATFSATFTAAFAADTSPKASAPNPNDNVEYRNIYTLYGQGDYESALKRMSSFERLYPSSKTLPAVENLHGMTYLMMQRPLQAVPYFKKAAEAGRGQPGFSQYVFYNLATAQFEANQIDDAQDTLSDIHPDTLDRENRIKVHYLNARIYQKRELPLEAAQECLTASRLLTLPEAQANRSNPASIAALLDSVMADISSVATVQDLYKNYGDSPFADIVLYRLASLQMKQGNRDQAFSEFKTLTAQFPQSPKAPLATQMIAADQSTGPVEPGSIGVLLPLSGKFQRFGNRSLQAIELALGIFGVIEPKSKITLVMEDSGDDADQAVAALERLVNRDHVVAVIGPLLSKGIDAVTERAQELGIPLVSLARASSSTALAGSGSYVFQEGITLQMQAEQIARYAVQKLGFTKFAEAYPRDKVGTETAGFFWDAIDALGAEMVGAESYASDETDFRQVVDKLSGLYYTEARQSELDELAKQRELNNIRKRTRKTEQYYSLKPIVDYQAVFIPEDPKSTGQLLPTFAYRDVEQIRFLGTAAWNSPELASRAQSYAEGVLFTDAFFSGSQEPHSRQFSDAFRATFGSEPTSMEAIAYDAGRLVSRVVAEGASTRVDVKSKLQDVKDFAGATGKIAYSNGLFTRELKILTIHDGKIVEAAN